MPHDSQPGAQPGPPAADPAREALLDQARAALARRLPPHRLGAAGAFLISFTQGLTRADLMDRSAEDIAGAALSLWLLAERRERNEVLVRVTAAQDPNAAWRTPFAVAEIVTDDMPFLVDSALGVLQRLDMTVHHLLHPIVPAPRDAGGTLLDAGAGPAESRIQIAFGPEGDPARLAQVHAGLAHAMADTRAAVTDFPAMLATLTEASEGGDAATAEFLVWLRDENFVLLGVRRLRLRGDAITTVDGSSLGLLRDPAVPVFDVLRLPGGPPPAVLAALRDTTDKLWVVKANMRSTVHRPQHADVVLVKTLGADGAVNGAFLFLGLFAATAYNRNPRAIPVLRDKVERILAMAGADPATHDGRALRNVLDTWPRDELFQAPEALILDFARRVMALQVRPRLALFLRPDPFGRYVSAIVYVPRDTFDTRVRRMLGETIARAFNGRLSTFYIALGDAPLARVHYIIGTEPGRVPAVDHAGLERALAQAARSFPDRLREALASAHGAEAAARLASRWAEAFPGSYTEDGIATAAVGDIANAERAMATNVLVVAIQRDAGEPAHRLSLELFNPRHTLALSDILPLIETLGLRVLEERPHLLRPAGAEPVSLQVLALETADGGAVDLIDRGPALAQALFAIWSGRTEADAFNRLVLCAGLDWRQAWLLRAMHKWCRQVGFPFSDQAVAEALASHPRAARLLVDLFSRRFDPAARDRDETRLTAEWETVVDAVTSADHDRILRRLRMLLDAVLRTDFWQQDGRKPTIALKIDSARAGDMPLPRPVAEIWVHGPRMEGCHLRGGRVARGGIRWSDRREDFRTEILGLMKAQMVKNVIIVPVGAKGGFVLKAPPRPSGDAARDRAALAEEGVACYRLLVGSMLDLTDNLRGQDVVPPAATVRADADDPYIVAAADKGTATFSDIANGLSEERGFWLGDAFASGGSKGYDHKVMGITARGAWVNIARHFRELGRDIQKDAHTCAGVGDMSGDVFGNGLLVSPMTRLVAAFDHRHIFIDPDPPADAIAERQRLFALPRSAWADYDAARISAGGGVFPRSAKSIALSPQARALLGIGTDRAEPAEVMRAILRARVDLLYFGGIGTYVKATHETQADAGDRANDALRVNAGELRAQVLGEGANLGVTQAARIEAARAGVHLNTDALDNSAGVSTSDHEVNIKILLADALAGGEITERQRVDLLETMTDEVAALVLRDNHEQSRAVSLDALGGAADLPAQQALMTLLEQARVLDRSVAGLPDTAEVAARVGAGQGLTRPEVCALMAHAKLWLKQAIDASSLPDDPALEPALVAYFPTALRTRFAGLIARHRLRRELVTTHVTNELINRLGHAAFARLVADAVAMPQQAAGAALVAQAAFSLGKLWQRVDALEPTAPADALLAALAAVRHLHEAASRALLGNDAPLAAQIASLLPGVAHLAAQARAAAADGPVARAWAAQGIPMDLAIELAMLPALAAAPGIVRLAGDSVPVADAAAAWTAAGETFGTERLRAAVASAPATGPWGSRAAAALQDDLAGLQAALAQRLLTERRDAPALLAALGSAAERAVDLALRAAAANDLAAATVAARGLRALG